MRRRRRRHGLSSLRLRPDVLPMGLGIVGVVFVIWLPVVLFLGLKERGSEPSQHAWEPQEQAPPADTEPGFLLFR